MLSRLLRRRPLLLRIGLAFVIAGALAAADQATKNRATMEFLEWSHPTDPNMYQGASRPLFTLPTRIESQERLNFFDSNLTYLRNPGAAWGMFSQMKPQIRSVLFILITVAVVGFILWEVSKQARVMSLAYVAYACVLGGAIGNAIDRLQQGYVTDWIHFEWRLLGWSYSFPVFNAADIFINIGVLLLLWSLLIAQPKHQASG